MSGQIHEVVKCIRILRLKLLSLGFSVLCSMFSAKSKVKCERVVRVLIS